MHTHHSEQKIHNGIEFVYRSYRCRITYNGIRPHFRINGQNAENYIDHFEVMPDNVGRKDWKYKLMKAIDKMEGENIESEMYINPKDRVRIRERSKRYLYSLADVCGGIHEAHRLIAQSEYDNINKIRLEIKNRAWNLIDNGEYYGLEAFDKARNDVLLEILENNYDLDKSALD